jgi:two-component system, NtrC family, sensor histidine kinase HydH
MSGHDLLSAITCVAHLAFAILVWSRRERSPIAVPLALLFGTAFAYNFSELAFQLSGEPAWHYIDRFSSTFMAVLLFQLASAFVGMQRRMRPLVRACVGLSFVLALSSSFWPGWWKVLCAAGILSMLSSLALLVRHRQQVTDVGERARTELVLAGVAVGAFLALTDLWNNEVSFPMPALGNLGTLIGLALIATATLRLRLLGREVPTLVVAYALLAGLLSVAGYLAAVRFFSHHAGVWFLSGLSSVIVATLLLRELTRAKAAVRARTEHLLGLGRFSAQLAHDLRNPLAALKGSLQFLAVEHEQGRSLDAQTEFLGLMHDQVERMSKVVENYQRLGKVEARPALTSLNELVESVLGMQRFAVGEQVTLRAELDRGLPSCQIDRELIAAALENVLRNAYEAMPTGGEVTVRTEPATRGRGGVVLSVEDHGAGVDPRELGRITDEFYTTKATGSGLGLNFAERVAKAHGGALEIASALGRGTTVKFRLPTQRPSGPLSPSGAGHFS